MAGEAFGRRFNLCCGRDGSVPPVGARPAFLDPAVEGRSWNIYSRPKDNRSG
jgi:hypothetical protein